MEDRLNFLALVTDFGLKDGYVAIMKGVIAQINPQVQVIDLTHLIPPQDIAAARFCLMNAYPYFPSETVYVAVVDPGVGTQRRAIAVQMNKSYWVGPDNGLFSGILNLSNSIKAIELTNSAYWRVPNPSKTFHGRDIFAPVGAHLANGVEFEKLGTKIVIKSLVSLPLPKVMQTPKTITGCVQYIDHFGNLITNISQDLLLALTKNIKFIKIQETQIPIGATYNDVKLGDAIALIGSDGWLEIAVRGGNAQSQFQSNWGDPITIIF